MKAGKKNKLWSFKEARAFVHTLNLKSIKEWDDYVLSPSFCRYISTKPISFYRGEGFCGWRDWIGVQRYNHMTLQEFIIYCRTILVPKGIDNSAKFKKIAHTLPGNIHRSPIRGYGKDWPGWVVIFQREGKAGTRQGGRRKGTIMTFEDARSYTRKYLVPIGITGLVKWEERIKEIPPSLPRRLYLQYKRDWVSTEDFFGVEQFYNLPKGFLPYEEAKKWFHENLPHITNSLEWNDRSKWGIDIPSNIPKRPFHFYRDKGWISWYDWFNKVRKDGKPIEKRAPRPSGKIVGELAKRRQAKKEEERRQYEIDRKKQEERREQENKKQRQEEQKQPEKAQVFVYKGIFSNKMYSDLYTNHYESMVRYAYQYIADEDTRRDIISTVFAKIPKAAERIEFESDDHLKRYTYRAARNTCIDYLREKGKTIYSDVEVTHDHHYEDHINMEGHKNNLASELRKKLNGIAKTRRKVLELYFFHHKTTVEIADELGIATQTVLNHKTKGLAALRKDKPLSNLVNSQESA